MLFLFENILTKPWCSCFGLYEMTILNLTHQTMCCCAPCLRFPPSNGMCSCYRAVCAFGMLLNRFLCDQREKGKWSAALGLPGVHVAFVQVRGSSAEPGEVQRARGNGNEREHIHQHEVASGSCSSVYPCIEGLIRYFHWWVGVIERIETTHIKLVNDKLSGPPAVLEERIRR